MAMQKNMDSLLENLGGCGRFQMALSSCLLLVRIFPVVASMMFMSFGNYNPGWTCLDNETFTEHQLAPKTNGTEGLNTTSDMSSDDKQKCNVYKSCRNLTFNSDASTIVTEWHLLCDDAWVTSVIISIQMAGSLVGSYISGRLGDRIGRKLTICSMLLGNCVFNLIAAFSVSWRMFAVLRFFIGITVSGLIGNPLVHITEFLNPKGRACLVAFPEWSIGWMMFAGVLSLIRDWKYVHLYTAAISLAVFIPLLFVPESIRWLAVNQKPEKAVKVAERVARTNKLNLQKSEIEAVVTHTTMCNSRRKTSYTDLFRKNLRLISIVLALESVCVSITYYAIAFGVKSFSGNFYVNLFLSALCTILSGPTGSSGSVLFGRKKTVVAYQSIVAICFATNVCLQFFMEDNATRGALIVVLAYAGMMFIDAAWVALILHVVEMYPTVVRSLGLNYHSLMARIGGILAPWLIPKHSSSISYIVMCILTVVCSALYLFLPDTKGKPMQDNLTTSTDISDAISPINDKDSNQETLLPVNGLHVPNSRHHT